MKTIIHSIVGMIALFYASVAGASTPTFESADAMLQKEHTVILKVVNATRQDVEALRRDEKVSPIRIRKALDFFQNFADARHHRKEQDHYFPAIEKLGGNPQHVGISSFLNDHTLYRVLLDKVRAGIGKDSVSPTVAEPLALYLSSVSLHICRENKFFKKAQPWIKPGEEKNLLRQFRKVEKDLGDNFHQKYKRIAMELAGS